MNHDFSVDKISLRIETMFRGEWHEVVHTNWGLSLVYQFHILWDILTLPQRNQSYILRKVFIALPLRKGISTPHFLAGVSKVRGPKLTLAVVNTPASFVWIGIPCVLPTFAHAESPHMSHTVRSSRPLCRSKCVDENVISWGDCDIFNRGSPIIDTIKPASYL